MSPDTMVVSDVRVIASVSTMPDVSIKNNLLLNDLYVRLCVVTIAMPSIKKRSEDMAVLTKAYIKEIVKQHNGYELEFTTESLELLQTHEWHNNLLGPYDVIKNVIQDAYRRHDYKAITRKHIHDYLPQGETLLNDSTMQQSVHKPLREAREVFEKNYLLYHLNRFKGNISRTAQFVGMERSALHRKLRSLDIENLRDDHYDLVD
jgi:two-component system nitrogen regulation response regulator NtrX